MEQTTFSVTKNYGGEDFVINYKATFDEGVLELYTIVTDEDGNETEIKGPSQPFKCNPDGTRSDFADSSDAFDWIKSENNPLT